MRPAGRISKGPPRATDARITDARITDARITDT